MDCHSTLLMNRGTHRCDGTMARLFIALRLVAGLTIGLSESAYAQAASPPLASLDLERVSFVAVQRYSPADGPHRKQLEVPENMFVAPKYRVTLETMLARSPSFRRQCVRIANERSLTVHVHHMPVRLAGGVRAITYISRSSAGGIVAHVTLHPFDDDVEMIAHEFEHIIEQLDDVDLTRKARRAHSGVRAMNAARSVFETTRALQVGQRVVEEVRQNTREGS
jgi:hypothetical protein